MCGIYGYIGPRDPLQVCLAGLTQLEYRGYDSTGVAGIRNGEIAVCKKAGKLSNLKKELSLDDLALAIGHTRWATHGKVNDQNAHPHLDASGAIAIVHNGIIENYDVLRTSLKEQGVPFSSETDTEVIVQLIARMYEGDLVAAVQKTLPLLQGIYAIAVIHRDHPDEIVAAARDCPLSIGIDDQKTESYVSSDPNTFLSESLNVLFLRDNEVARIKKGSVEVYNAGRQSIDKKIERLETGFSTPSKEGYDHYLIKEIHEQPTTILKALLGRFQEETGNVEFESFGFTNEELRSFRNVWILGCGTSAHAGLIGAMYLEDFAKVPAFCEFASEARYRSPLLSKDTLVIAMSQSGETADTIAAMRAAKAAGCKTLVICNVKLSTLPREADGAIFLKAGPEVSVCSSKAFTSQIAVLALFALLMARLREYPASSAKAFFEQFKKIPDHVRKVLEGAPKIEELAKKYSAYNDFFFMGRLYMYVTSCEAALKLKEISYAHAHGHPAGELKHGSIALLDANFPVVAFCANQKTKDKILSNLTEVKARGSPLLAFAPEGMQGIESVADDIIWLPPTIDQLAPFSSIVAAQLFAYYFAKERGCDIDQPRNLAKSVTVE